VWHVARNRADRAAIERAAQAIRAAKNPVIIAGGGAIYSEATEQLRQFAEQTGIGIGLTQAGKGALAYDHELCLGALGSSGTKFANGVANQADLVIGIGTRYTDFTTGSNTLFKNPEVRFVNINVAEIDAHKEAAIPLIGDARETLAELGEAVGDWHIDEATHRETIRIADGCRALVDDLTRVDDDSAELTQETMLGVVNRFMDDRDLIINAAGSMPGDLHRLWRPGSVKGYDIEYGNSCMGYEIPAGVGAKLADPDRGVYVLIGDASYLMLSSDIMSAVQENLKLTILIVDNHGFGSIGALSDSVGSQAFGCNFLERGTDQLLDGQRIDVDFATNAASYGATILHADTPATLREALTAARDNDGVSVIYLRVSRKARFDGSGAIWDVVVPEISTLESTQEARVVYEQNIADQQLYLNPSER
jgi:3D-(3,5/4)-trihydroxycyclohexane-1,2-dione acylhydrolase (decyclizing)